MSDNLEPLRTLAERKIMRQRRLLRLLELVAPLEIIEKERRLLQSAREEFEALVNKLGIDEETKKKILEAASRNARLKDQIKNFLDESALGTLGNLLLGYGSTWTVPPKKWLDPKFNAEQLDLLAHELIRGSPEELEETVLHASCQEEAILALYVLLSDGKAVILTVIESLCKILITDGVPEIKLFEYLKTIFNPSSEGN